MGPAVGVRFHKLLFALGKEFDGKIEGINLAETAVSFGESGRLFPKGFTPAVYRDAVIANMTALKRAFPKAVTMQYANFMPGEWLPGKDQGYLRSVYQRAKNFKLGVGGPDLLPGKPGQMSHCYPLIREAARIVPTGIAVRLTQRDVRSISSSYWQLCLSSSRQARTSASAETAPSAGASQCKW